MDGFFLPIAPVSKPRMTKRDRWAKRPAVVKFWKFKDDLASVRDDLAAFILKNADVQITFAIPVPKSWSKKKANSLLLDFHRQRPDVDNLLKGLLDAVMDEDSAVCSLFCQKIWSRQGFILVTKGMSFRELNAEIKKKDKGLQDEK